MKRLLIAGINLYFRLAFLRKMLWSIIVFSCTSIALVIIFQSRNTATKPVGWEKSFFITSYKLKVQNLKVSNKGKMMAAVYEASEEGKKNIYVSVSFNGGNSFLKPVKVAETSGFMKNNPSVAISSKGDITIVWNDLISDDATTRLFMCQSSNFGAKWTKAERLYVTTEMEVLPRIFYDSRDRLHLFYNGLQKRVFNLYHSTLKNNKFQNIKPIVNFSGAIKGAFFPAILFNKRSVFLMWQGKRTNKSDTLYYMKSENLGNSWSSAVSIMTTKSANASPALFMKNNVLYCAYRNNENKNWSIRLIAGKNRGQQWDTKSIAISDTNADCYKPGILGLDNALLIVWYDNREKKTFVYSRKYDLTQRALKPEVKLSTSRWSSRNPELLGVGRKSIVLWEEANRIRVKYSDIYVSPPIVYSISHPQNRWSRTPIATIRWKAPRDESGIVGYAVIVTRPSDSSRIHDINPGIKNIKGERNRYIIPQLQDGITYFHIRAIDGAGNFSRTVHFPVKTSANPLPRPVVVSSTHPPLKSNKKKNASFAWSVTGADRLKGFIYSLSRNKAKDPQRFTTDFKKTFKDLKQGRYFLTIRAIDKTNLESKTETYPFIVGASGEMKITDINKIIKGDKTGKKKTYLARVQKPSIFITLPFDKAKVYRSDSFSTIIESKYIDEKSIDGYAVVLSKKNEVIPEKVNHRSKILNIKELTKGAYTMKVRARYYYYKNNKKIYAWTDSYVSKFSVSIPPLQSPVNHYYEYVFQKLKEKSFAVILFFLISSGFFFYIIYGPKISYIVKSSVFRFKSVVRVIIGR